MKKLLLLILPILFALPNFAHADITTGLVGWWHLNGDVLDYSGSGFNGTAVGSPTYTTGNIWSQAISLNGTSQYVNVSGFSLPSATQLTVSLWLKTSSISGVPISSWGSGANGFGIYSDIWYVGVPNGWSAGSARIITDNAWHLYTLTWDGSTINVYVDGAYQYSVSSGSSYSPNATYALSLGTDDRTFGSNDYPGSVGDARVYNRALTSSDVAQLYAYTGLVPKIYTAFTVFKSAVFSVFKGSIFTIY